MLIGAEWQNRGGGSTVVAVQGGGYQHISPQRAGGSGDAYRGWRPAHSRGQYVGVLRQSGAVVGWEDQVT